LSLHPHVKQRELAAKIIIIRMSYGGMMVGEKDKMN
jgi:hypothetical protein